MHIVAVTSYEGEGEWHLGRGRGTGAVMCTDNYM